MARTVAEDDADRLHHERVGDLLRDAGYSMAINPGRPRALAAQRTELGRQHVILIDTYFVLTAEELGRRIKSIRGALETSSPSNIPNEHWIVYERGRKSGFVKLEHGLDRRIRVLSFEELSRIFPKPKAPRRAPARTKIGKAVQASPKEVQLAIAGLLLQIDAKLEALREERPNSSEARAKLASELSDFERMKAELERIRELVAAFKKDANKEKELVQSVTTFKDGVKNWWDRSHLTIINSTAQTGVFVGAASFLHMVGADSKAALAIAGTLIGGETVVKAIRALPRKFW